MGLWVPPIYRAELHFESRSTLLRLIEIIRRERVSVLAAVPSVLALLKTDLEISYPWLAEKLAAAQNFNAGQRWWHFLRIHREFGLKFGLSSGGGAVPGPLELGMRWGSYWCRGTA